MLAEPLVGSSDEGQGEPKVFAAECLTPERCLAKVICNGFREGFVIRAIAEPVQTAPSLEPPARKTKYRPLYDYLRQRPAGEVVMSTRSIEIVLKTMLPNAAASPGWWLISDDEHASRSWKAAGFLAELQTGGQTVRFRRAGRSTFG